MSENFDIFNEGKEGSIQAIADKYRVSHPWLPDNNTLNNNVLWKTYEADDYNFVMNTLEQTNTADVAFTFGCRTVKLKFTAPDTWRCCFVKFPNAINVEGTNETISTESLILCAVALPDFSGRVDINSFPDNAPNTTYNVAYDNGTFSSVDNTTSRTTTARWFDIANESNIDDWVYSRYSGTIGGVNHHNITDEQKADIFSKLKNIVNRRTSGDVLRVMRFASYGEPQFNLNDWGMLGDERSILATYEKLPFPVFDYTQVDDIVKYINTGDDSGAINPFDITPDKTELEDLTNTSYRIFVSPDTNDKKKTHFSIIAYNPEYIEYGENVAGEYGMHVSLDYMRTQTSASESFNLGNFAQSKYPTLGYIMSNVGYSSVFNLSFRNLNDATQPIRVYSVGFEADKSKESNCQLVGANYGGQSLIKKHIVDGYRFEHGNNWIEVLFRAVDISDLNGGYPDPDDTYDDKSGTDSDYSGASGLRTFVINNTDFDTINSKLWSTDWSTVFKSNSIDPIRCVIACKGIPFTADNVSSAEIMIANLDTGLSKNYVKTVKSFTTNSVLMPSFSGDFTDITLTHIRCYLPYIGWVEIPASECISRVAYTSVGIEARPKRLKFKYLVDFVDGNVRCIVSVNDTERWFFDGNCAIDIPVTSDNHTQAISNAIRSGVQTGLSIVTAIGGAVAKNAGAVAGGVMGAMQSAPNIFPTYSFTATSNGSGYINASMNQHIMLVIEHPNVIRSADYAKRVGVPCGLSLNLGSLHGYTRCVDVNVTGIDATPNEIQRIKSLLESGVYL